LSTPPPFDALTYAMDHTPWALCFDEDGLQVFRGLPVYGPDDAPHPTEGFLIRAKVKASRAHGMAYFHDACHFARTANHRTTRDEILRVDDPRRDHYRALVRTGFSLPWPLRDREFLHTVGTTVRDGRGLIAYGTLPADHPIAPPWPGYLRCPMEPSGQRLTPLDDGWLLAEHCMTYDLGGRITPPLQNVVFHRGHVRAYAEEWRAAMAVLSREAQEGPPAFKGRDVTPRPRKSLILKQPTG